MKAWSCIDRNCEHGAIVFAETRGKAKQIALHIEPFWDEGYEFTEIVAYRMKNMDQCYRGENHMDWENPEDRLAMVMYGGFTCSDDSFDPEECESCSAKTECGMYAEFLEESGSEEEE